MFNHFLQRIRLWWLTLTGRCIEGCPNAEYEIEFGTEEAPGYRFKALICQRHAEELIQKINPETNTAEVEVGFDDLFQLTGQERA